MSRHDEIKNAYKSLGGEATFYDGMITCSTLPGKAVCKLVWNMNKKKNDRYLELALAENHVPGSESEDCGGHGGFPVQEGELRG